MTPGRSVGVFQLLPGRWSIERAPSLPCSWALARSWIKNGPTNYI